MTARGGLRLLLNAVSCINPYQKSSGSHPKRFVMFSQVNSSLSWTVAMQDIRYLKPHVEDVMKEDQERQLWNTMAVGRK